MQFDLVMSVSVRLNGRASTVPVAGNSESVETRTPYRGQGSSDDRAENRTDRMEMRLELGDRWMEAEVGE